MESNLKRKEYNKQYYKLYKEEETPEQKRERLDKLKNKYIEKKKSENPNWVPKNKKRNIVISPNLGAQ